MATVSFKKGLLANLPATKAAGTFYVTTDERAMYLDVDDSTRIRLGDFQEFANTTALTANPNPSTTALYYVTDINCLAKWNGSEYIQINKDTGMTSIEVTGDGNAVTAAVYDASGRKLTLTKGATYMTAADVDGKISDKVGAIEGTVKNYVDEKTSGIASDAALTELAGRVTTAEGKITALENANKEGGAVANAIKAAQDAADAAQATADGAQSAAEAAQADVDALEGKVGTVPADKTVVGMIGEVETAYKAKDNELAASIKAISDDYLKSTDKTELQGNIDKKVDQTAYNAKVSALETADTTLQNNIDAEKTARENADNAQVTRIATLEDQIKGLSGAMHFEGVKAEVPADVTGYEAGDVIIVGEKEYVFNGTAFVEFGDVSAEGERIAALETTVGDENSGLVKSVANNASAIATEKSRAEGAESALSGRIDALEDIDHDAYALKTAVATDKAELEGKISANTSAIETLNGADTVDGSVAKKIKDAIAAENLSQYATDTELSALDARVVTVEGKAHTHDNKAELDKIATGDKAKWDAVVSDHLVAADKTELENAIATKANSADVYTKTEVDVKLTGALSWGEF